MCVDGRRKEGRSIAESKRKRGKRKRRKLISPRKASTVSVLEVCPYSSAVKRRRKKQRHLSPSQVKAAREETVKKEKKKTEKFPPPLFGRPFRQDFFSL